MPKQRPASQTIITASTRSCLEAPHSWGAWWLCKMKAGPCCVLTNNTQDMNQIARTRVYISLLPAYTSILFSSGLHLHSLFLPYWTHRQHPELSRHHVTCTKQRLSFQNTPNNLHNFVYSLWACFRCVQLYHNANALDVDSFSTRSDGTKGQPQRKGEGDY